MGDHRTADHPAVARLISSGAIDGDALEALRSRLPGADLTSLLLDAMSHRAAARSPADLLRRRDGFTAPAAVDARRLLELQVAVANAIHPEFELIEVSPLAPLGTNAVLGGVSQQRVVSTARSNEVIADPTTSLALEGARRRRRSLADDPADDAPVRLAAIERIVRAQRFEGPRSFAHFTLLGLITAGRDRGGRDFEAETMTAHIRALIAACRACGHDVTAVRLTDVDGRLGDVLARVIDDIARVIDDIAPTGAEVSVWPDREAGRGYYTSLCFKLAVQHDGVEVEVGDGGLTDWTQQLVGSRKERLMTSGLSLERLAML